MDISTVFQTDDIQGFVEAVIFSADGSPGRTVDAATVRVDEVALVFRPEESRDAVEIVLRNGWSMTLRFILTTDWAKSFYEELSEALLIN